MFKAKNSSTNFLKFWATIFLFIFYINGFLIETKIFPEIFVFCSFIIYFSKKYYEYNKYHYSTFLFPIISIFLLIYSYIIGDNNISKEVYRLLFVPVCVLSIYILNYDVKKILKFLIGLSLLGGFILALEFIILNTSTDYLRDLLLGYQNYLRGVGEESPKRMIGIDFYFNEINILRPNGLFNGPQKSGFLFVIGTLCIWFNNLVSLQANYSRKDIFLVVLLFIFTILSTSRSALVSILIMYLFMFKKGGIVKISLYMLLAGFLYWAINLLVNADAYSGPLYSDFGYFFHAEISKILFGSGMVDDDNFSVIHNIIGEHFLIRIIIVCGLVPLSFICISYILLILEVKRFNYYFSFYIFLLSVLLTIHYSIINEYYVFMSLSIIVASALKLAKLPKIFTNNFNFKIPHESS